MFGTYRLILSVLVVLSHNHPLRLNETFNFGIFAVVCFFILSGYLMSAKLCALSSHWKFAVTSFYLDRLLRIYPLFCFFVLLQIIFSIAVPLNLVHLPDSFTFKNFLYNFSLLPLNYYIPETQVFLSQTWSLAVEAQFYLLCPFFFFFSKLRKLGIVAAIFVFFLGAVQKVDVQNLTIFHLPAALFPLLLGMLLHQNHLKKDESRWIWVISFFTLAFTFYLAFSNQLFNRLNFEVLLGLFVGAPLTAYLGRFSRKEWDDALGSGAYGTFLCHSLVLTLLYRSFPSLKEDWALLAPLSITLSVAIGFLSHHFLEKPYASLRRSLTKNNEASVSLDLSFDQLSLAPRSSVPRN